VSLVVENGTGLANAEAFIGVTDADTYAASRGLTAWASATTAAKEVALRKGADYLCRVYSYVGVPSNNTQALAWPRVDAVDPYRCFLIEGVPAELKQANVELAFRALTTELLPDAPGNTTGFLTMESEEVGGAIRETKQYAAGIGPQTPRYRSIDTLLRRLLQGHGKAYSERA